jgi:hypothetical protein
MKSAGEDIVGRCFTEKEGKRQRYVQCWAAENKKANEDRVIHVNRICEESKVLTLTVFSDGILSTGDRWRRGIIARQTGQESARHLRVLPSYALPGDMQQKIT